MDNITPNLEDKRTFKMVILESPYAGDIQKNVAYARLCMRDSILRGEAPFASHLLYTQDNILDDNNAEERVLGMKIGMEIATRCDYTVVYDDLGISRGMQYGIDSAIKAGRKVVYRSIAVDGIVMIY